MYKIKTIFIKLHNKIKHNKLKKYYFMRVPWAVCCMCSSAVTPLNIGPM